MTAQLLSCLSTACNRHDPVGERGSQRRRPQGHVPDPGLAHGSSGQISTAAVPQVFVGCLHQGSIAVSASFQVCIGNFPLVDSIRKYVKTNLI
eukprot:359472-Chlamydomonas_euryale.AAC.3